MVATARSKLEASALSRNESPTRCKIVYVVWQKADAYFDLRFQGIDAGVVVDLFHDVEEARMALKCLQNICVG